MEIIITDRTLERVAYGFIIVILILLLGWSFLRDCDCVDGQNVTGAALVDTAGGVANQTANETAAEPVQEPEEPVETCDDDIKNQDETDVDCGGDQCSPCAEGDRCLLNADCAKGSCDDGICDAAPELSGEFTIEVEDVTFIENDDDRAKVTAIELTMENGFSDETSVRVELYLRTSDGVKYLNQLPLADSWEPYAILQIGPMIAGWKNEQVEYELDGRYEGGSWLTGDYYDPGDDFQVEAVAINTRTGDELDSAVYRVNI